MNVGMVPLAVCRKFLLAASLWLVLSGAVMAQAQDAPAALPTTPDAWINAPPLSLENLKGKGVVLWFFEEDCPRCREKWPSLLETAASFKGRPVLFVGVNSGTARPELERYLGEIKCTWPVICDSNRTFEKACGVPEISLDNIMQCKLITPGGALAMGRWDDVSGTAERALENAKWNTDPDKVPSSLQDLLTAVEFGMYPAAITRLKAAFKKAETKEGAEYLIAFIKEKANEEAAEVEKLIAAGDDWQTYKAILAFAEKFKGMPLPDSLTESKTKLTSSDIIKKQLKAKEQFEAAAKAAQAGTHAGMKKAKAIVDKLIKDFGETEAGELAKKMMENPLGARPPGAIGPAAGS